MTSQTSITAVASKGAVQVSQSRNHWFPIDTTRLASFLICYWDAVAPGN